MIVLAIDPGNAHSGVEWNSRPGIYVIYRRGAEGRAYIGSAVNIRKRWGVHLCQLRGGYHHSPALQNAWNKYGEGEFSFAVLENVDCVDDLIPREQSWLDACSPEYNICKVAGSHLGVKRSVETRRRISEALTGKEHTEETREKLSRIFTGRAHSQESREKMSEYWYGRPRGRPSKEARANMSKGQRGRKHSAETRAKMSESHKGRNHSDEAKAKISAARKGRAPHPNTLEGLRKYWEARRAGGGE